MNSKQITAHLIVILCIQTRKIFTAHIPKTDELIENSHHIPRQSGSVKLRTSSSTATGGFEIILVPSHVLLNRKQEPGRRLLNAVLSAPGHTMSYRHRVAQARRRRIELAEISYPVAVSRSLNTRTRR